MNSRARVPGFGGAPGQSISTRPPCSSATSRTKFSPRPVLLRPLLQAVAPVAGRWLDGTFGAGGYTRGLLAAGAAQVAVQTLRKEFGVEPGDVAVAIGPSIGRCCYDVGPELVDAFAEAGHSRLLIDRWFQPPIPMRAR